MVNYKYKKEDILKAFIDISRKLGKLPSKREFLRLANVSNSPVETMFESFSKLTEAAISKSPSLEELRVPVRVSLSDIEEHRLSLEKSANSKFNKNQTVFSSQLEYIKALADSSFKGRITGSSPKSRGPVKRVLNLVLSDTHFGSNTEAVETGYLDYGVVEESRRLAAVIKQAMEYKPEHRKNTKLELLLLGDLIDGKLHDPQHGAPLAEQCIRAIHLLSQAVGQLASAFPEVNVRFQGGNHGRIISRHKQRAVNQKWDNLETIVVYGVKSACDKLKNVTFHIPKTPFGSYDVFGSKIWYSHGDTVLNPGYPGSSINIKSLEQQVNKLNAALTDRDEYDVFVLGHVHTASVTQLSNGSTIITNGALCPPDDFAVSIGISEGVSSQVMFESVPEHPVGDLRMITVSAEDDKNESLDKLIKPWKNM